MQRRLLDKFRTQERRQRVAEAPAIGRDEETPVTDEGRL